MLQYSIPQVLKYWLYSYKQNNQICETLHAQLWSCIQEQIAKTDCVKLDLGIAQCSSLLCSVQYLHSNFWRSVGAQLWDVGAISSWPFLPIKPADRFIVGFLRSIAVSLCNMWDQKSLMLRWCSVDAHFGPCKWCCCKCFCLERRPIVLLWINVVA
jgi:hypothetical protein